MRFRFVFCLLATLVSLVSTAQPVDTLRCEAVKIEVEPLPELNTPRYGHCVFFANGELTVIGGHTTGFVPTATAEYFSDGAWHIQPAVYPHDHGIVIPMKSGRVLICGGCREPLGIGQTFTAEWYDPATHTCEPLSPPKRGGLTHKEKKHYRMRNNLYICNANPQTKTTLISHICGSNFGTHYTFNLK